MLTYGVFLVYNINIMTFKFFYTFLICLGLTTTINAQETIIPLENDNSYIVPMTGDIYHKDTTNVLDKYMETWIFDDGINYFKITFYKKARVRVSNMRFYMDELVCKYLFKINGTTIYNTYVLDSSITDDFISGSRVQTQNKIILSYEEPSATIGCSKYASGELTLNYLPGTTPTLVWNRVNDLLCSQIDTCPDGTPIDLTDFVIPANMILTKQ